MKRLLNWFKRKPLLKIVKETKIDGEVSFYAYYDDVCQKAFYTQKEAEEWMNKVLSVSKNGYPIKETIKSIEI